MENKQMIEEIKYIYNVHCGNSDCYACAKQHKNCSRLDKLDEEIDQFNHEKHMEQMNKNPLFESYKKEYFGKKTTPSK